MACLICVNAEGGKEKILFIGNSANPRNFPKHHSSLPVTYTYSKKAWMNSQIWTSYLKQWDRRLKLQNRKILLLIDNAPSHPIVQGLTQVRVEFLPKNTTSLIQPCDIGVIKVFKGYYRSFVTERILREINLPRNSNLNATVLAKRITKLNAVHLVKKAWNCVSKQRVKNCFKKALGHDEFTENVSSSVFLTDIPIPASIPKDVFYEQIDLPHENDFTEAELDESDNESDDEENNIEIKPLVTYSQCMMSLQEMRNYFEISGGDEPLFNAISLLENEFLKVKLSESSSQRRITDRFAHVPDDEDLILNLCKSLEKSGLNETDINLCSNMYKL